VSNHFDNNCHTANLQHSPEIPSSSSEPAELGVGMEALSLSSTSAEFTVVTQSLSCSEYDVVSNAEFPSEAIEDQAEASTEANASSDRPSTPDPGTTNKHPPHALSRENVSLLLIQELAGGSIQKYQQMIIADLKHKRGVPFTAKSAIPLPHEIIGDQVPGYDAMSLGAKFWSWWTRSETRIFDNHVLKGVLEELKEQAQGGALELGHGKATAENEEEKPVMARETNVTVLDKCMSRKSSNLGR
jgi:hypothetical protein